MRLLAVIAAGVVIFSVTACSDAKTYLEERGFTNVRVQGDDKATATLGTCPNIELQIDGITKKWHYVAPGASGKSGGPAPIPVDRYEDPPTELLIREELKRCNSLAHPEWTSKEYWEELQRRGFKDITLMGEGLETWATVTLGTCKQVPLRWLGVKGYPDTVSLESPSPVPAPVGGFTAENILASPHFEKCRPH